MASEAAQRHDGMVAALMAQRERVLGGVDEDSWTGGRAEWFRDDPRREPEPILQAMLEYVRPDDVVVDVGGGAGRFTLPIALRCREVVNVDPSAGMRTVFESVVVESGIENARHVQQDWLDAEGIEGDVSIVSDVTYFVRDIEAFIQKLQQSSRRRVVIRVWAVPPPNLGSDIFRAVFNEEQALVPGHKELLPVLWELDILPEVRMPGGTNETLGLSAAFIPYPTREQAVDGVLGQSATLWRGPDGRERARQAVESHFDDVFEKTDAGYLRRYQPDRRNLLITWETGGK